MVLLPDRAIIFETGAAKKNKPGEWTLRKLYARMVSNNGIAVSAKAADHAIIVTENTIVGYAGLEISVTAAN